MNRDITLVLVDFDDTLVETAPRFDNARRRLFELMVSEGFDRDEAYRVHHHEVDPGLRDKHGFGPHRLEEAFRLTYLALCERDGREADPEMMDRAGALGRAVVGTPPTIDGAVEALERLAASLPVVVYTQAAEREYQIGCLRGAGVLDVVTRDRIRIVPNKTETAFRETLAAFGIHDPHTAWMVGNSIRSDVNPALSAGANAILVEVDDPWHHDVVTPISDDFHTVRSFAEAAELLMRRSDTAIR